MKCPECMSEMRRNRRKRKEVFKGKAVELSYFSYECAQCGNTFVDADSLENSWKRVWAEHEKLLDYPSPKSLKTARRNLGLTQEELAAAIGRTKSLISRLEDGSRKLSDELLAVYKDYIIPGRESFEDLLNKARVDGRISKEVWSRLLGRTNVKKNHECSMLEEMILKEHGDSPSEFTGFSVFNGERLNECTCQLFSLLGKMDLMKLLKLLFYVDAYSFMQKGRAQTGLRYQANHFGPTPWRYDLVVSYMKSSDLLRDSDKEHFLELKRSTGEIRNLASDETKIIREVARVYGGFDSKSLSGITHQEKSWKDARKRKLIRFTSDMIVDRISEE